VDETQALTAVAEVAIALAGFSGVVVVFRRSEDPWLPEDRFRIAVLVISSFMTAAFAFLPLLLWGMVGAEHRVWQASSACWSIFGIWLIVWSRSRIARIVAEDPAVRERVSPGVPNLMLYGIGPLFVLISISNAVLWGEFSPYLAVLVFGLVASGIQFGRILWSALR
jgi:hypothetical protein